jgi:hypothetical protein
MLRNDIVFNDTSPRIDQALLLAQNEADLQMLAGAKGLYTLWSLLDLVASVWWYSVGQLVFGSGAFVI